MDDENFISFLLVSVSYIELHQGLHVFSISDYGAISRKSSVFVIGGRCDDHIYSSLIAKYTNDKWERVGNLLDSRAYHRAIANQDRFYVLGGSGIL